MTVDTGAPTNRHADEVMEWLVALGYTHCFFVAGGNIMHFLNGARMRFTCVPFVHEVAAGIAAEYFNEVLPNGRAFALVTAGPGLTNIVTAIAGAYLESRELLVIGGQVKSSDLASNGIRQRGIQEVDGELIVRPICAYSERAEKPMSCADFVAAVKRGQTGRKGPVFLEYCLDAQGAPTSAAKIEGKGAVEAAKHRYESDVTGQQRSIERKALLHVDAVAGMLREAKRPIVLLGGGVTREAASAALPDLRRIGVPVQTTWNGIDRIGADEPIYAGRPNTWGQRFANILIQQSDLVIALGTRLGLQQTGFNWQEFVPLGKVVQVDVDEAELQKGHPRVDLAIAGDANLFLRELVRFDFPSFTPWLEFCAHVKRRLPLDDPANSFRSEYVNPYAFFRELSHLATAKDILIPCSSGGANSTALQAIEQKLGQLIVTDKGLASMGYGLSGAIGAALAFPHRRTILVEGDGGFIQNCQELGTVALNALDIKIFVFSNDGYASIRTTQKNYFGGAYVGCDASTGLGFPNWGKLFDAYEIPVIKLSPQSMTTADFVERMNVRGPQGFIVPVDPEQMYFPKIASRLTENGSMVSNPLHLMTPELEPAIADDVMRYLREVKIAG